MKNLTVIDFFCGAGGFSEGFRQQGYEIIRGYDNWKPAIDTYNHNFNLNCEVFDILKLADDIEAIEALPNTDIILGSPPCVSFSSSNKGGNANKDLGIDLIKTFLRVIAVKMHQPNSQLKAWFMENVTNSIKHTEDSYTFTDLNLTEWAFKNNLNPDDTAINFKDNRKIHNSADFGVAQSRKRLFAGEIISISSFPEFKVKQHKSVKEIFKYFPRPNKPQSIVTDPNYKIKISNSKLSDHYYDTGIYKSHWDYAEHHKTNHPYMGRMSFPENINKPSRTITATKLDNSREAIIYKSEIIRNGDGEFRTPTIREVGILMSFPITYQFIGISDSSKWRLVGNAVCPMVSSAVAKATLIALGLPILESANIIKEPNLENVVNLNTFKEKIFDNPPIRKKGSRFRRHPFKDGNMTIALSNYCLDKNGKSDNIWRSTITYGTGKNYKVQEVTKIEEINSKALIETLENGKEFLEKVHNGFSEKIACGKELQNMYEKSYSNGKLHPFELIQETIKLINEFTSSDVIETKGIFKYKDEVYMKQLYSLYVVSHISTKANSNY